jgi:hypothetical protein
MQCECVGIPSTAFHHFFQTHHYTHLEKAPILIEKVPNTMPLRLPLAPWKTGRNDGKQRMEFQNIPAPRSI